MSESATTTVKYLIVNADDFGASRGINRGIAEAHTTGIVTSTSLMVNIFSLLIFKPDMGDNISFLRRETFS